MLHSFPLMFLSCCIRCLSFCFHVLSCSAAMYQRYRPSKADMLNRSGGYPPKRSRLFFVFCYRFYYRLSMVFGGLCRLPSSGFLNMYRLVVVFFTLVVFWAGNALAVLIEVQAKLKWNARGYYTIPNAWTSHQKGGKTNGSLQKKSKYYTDMRPYAPNMPHRLDKPKCRDLWIPETGMGRKWDPW